MKKSQIAIKLSEFQWDKTNEIIITDKWQWVIKKY